MKGELSRTPGCEMPQKAYHNTKFLNSAGARPIRILSEYLEPQGRLDHYGVRDTIVFFGSSRCCDAETAERKAKEAKTAAEKKEARQLQQMSRYYEEARQLAGMLARWSDELSTNGKHFVICSGGGPGIMEAANRGASEAEAYSIGLNISLPLEQKPNPYITPELCFHFHYFFMRKLWFAYLAKALVVFPGGFGTLDEMAELLTLIQTDKIRKPIVVLIYGSEYWNRVINFEAMAEMGTISKSDLDLYRTADTPQEAFDVLTGWLEETYIKDSGRLPARGHVP